MSRFPQPTTQAPARPTQAYNNPAPASRAPTKEGTTRRLVKDPVRYKTIMCNNFLRNGACPYGFKCQFAHGKEELRERPKNKDDPQAAHEVGQATLHAYAPAASSELNLGALSIESAAAVANEPLFPPPLSLPADAEASTEPSPRILGVSAESPNDHVAPLLPADATTEGCGAQLVCNALTGEVEVALPPGAGRQVSHNTASVRRQISMLFEEDANAPPPPSSAAVWGSGAAIIGAC